MRLVPDTCLYLRYWSLLLLLLVAGCKQIEQKRNLYVARVGNTYLTEAEVQAYLRRQPPGADTLVLRQRYIEDWVTRKLLVQKARDYQLDQVPTIRKRIEESTEYILLQALLDSVAKQEIPSMIETELRAYYEQNREALKLREPYVRVRYVSTTHPDSAALARRLLQEATHKGEAEKIWPTLVHRFARDTTLSFLLASFAIPRSHLPVNLNPLWERLPRMKPGEITPVIPLHNQFHVLQLIEYIPEGTVPELEWIAPELRRELAIRQRKQLYQRYVQRLRQEALARNQLDIKTNS